MKTILFIFLFIPSIMIAQNELNAFYIGHSLSDQIPDMVASLARDHDEVSFNWAYQSIPGAPLRWQWDRKINMDYHENPPYYYAFYNEEGGLASGKYHAMILTEAVPRYGELINETYQYADSFMNYAMAYHEGIKTYLYEDWHCILSGTPTGCDYDIDSKPWRQRIDDDLPMWESVVDTLNKRYGDISKVCLIPAAQGLAQVYDSIDAGAIPGMIDFRDLFADNIHLNDMGKYFVACVHFATLFGLSPVGLTNQLRVWWGGDFNAPSPDLALKFQEIAWSVSTNYERSCIANTSQKDEKEIDGKLIIYPNPATDALHIKGKKPKEQLLLFNISGQLILETREHVIKTKNLVPGVYLLKSSQQTIRFVKN